MNGTAETLATVGAGIAAWLLTYALHATVLTLAAAALARLRRGREGWSDVLWRLALFGALATATVQSTVGGGLAPVSPRVWHVSALEPAPLQQEPLTPPPPSEPRVSGQVQESVAADGDATAAVPADAESAAEIAASESGRAVLWSWVVLAGVVGWLLVGSVRLVGLWRTRRRIVAALGDRRAVGGELYAWLAGVAADAGFGRSLRLTVSRSCPVPLAASGNEICVPERFLTQLSPGEQRAALAHELGHLVRRDPAWLLAACAVERLFFFQPLHRWALREFRAAAEYACDAWSLRRTGSPLPLARSLATIAGWLPAARAAAYALPAMAHPGSPLVRRVERILAGAPQRPVGRTAIIGFVTTLLVCVAGVAPAVGVGSGSARDGISSRSTLLERWVNAARAAQETVIHAPRPNDPLPERWRWAMQEGARRGGNFWIAYMFDGPERAGWFVISDAGARGVSYGSDRWSGPPVARLLLGDDVARTLVGRDADARTERRIALLFLFDESGKLRRLATRSLAVGMDFGGRPVLALGHATAEESVPFLESQLGALADETSLRGEVVDAIGTHRASELVVPVLARVLASDPTAEVRAEAAEGLELHPTDRAFELLVETANRDQDVKVRAEAAEALGELQHPRATGALIELALDSPDGPVRNEATEGLSDKPPAEAVPALRRIIEESTDRQTRREAVETLGDLGAAALDELTRIATGADEQDLRREAIESLGDLADTLDGAALERVAALLERIAFDDPSRSVQNEAIDAARELPSSLALRLLQRIADEHPSRSVREEARDKLRDMR